MATIKKDDLTHKTDHEKYIEQQEALLVQRQTELSKLESVEHKTPDIEKRIAKYNEIIFNIRTGIEFVKMGERTKRPYGL